MEPPSDSDLLRRVTVPLFAGADRPEIRMAACLVGRDVALTAAFVAEHRTGELAVRIDGQVRRARVEAVDEPSGLALLRFDPPATTDVPGVFSTDVRTVSQGARFLVLTWAGGSEVPLLVSGIIVGQVTLDGNPRYQIQVETELPDSVEHLGGAPVVVEGRVLGLVVLRRAGQGGEPASTCYVAPFSGARHAPFVDQLVSASQIEPGQPEDAPGTTLVDDGSLFAMLSPSSRLAVSLAEAMRLAVRLDRVHLEHLLAALQQNPQSSAAAALRAVGIDDTKLRELISQTSQLSLPVTASFESLSALPPLSRNARAALLAASRLSRDRIIHMRDLFAGAMSITRSRIVDALLGLGVKVPSDRATPEEPNAPASTPAPAQGAVASATAAELAGFRSDGVSGQTDLLDIQQDVEALCSVIAARDVEPPLSIGLFGDWGSGKSFFIEQMKQRLERIEAESDRAEQAASEAGRPIAEATRYWARITQLEFNAWRYIDTDLWASLADGIIDGLARALENPTIGKVASTERARLLAAAARSRDVIAEAETRKRTAEEALAKQEQVLREAIARARAPRRGAAAVRQQAHVLAVSLDQSLQDELAKVAKGLGADPMKREAEATLLELQGLGSTAKATWRAIRGNPPAALIGAAVLAALAYGLVALRDQIDDAIRWAIGIGVAGLTFVAGFRPYVQKARDAVGRIEQIISRHRDALDKAVADTVQREQQMRDRADADVKEADRGLTKVKRDLEEIEAQLLTLRADVQMAQFVKERQASDDYRKHLGVIARARSDFERLSDLLLRTRDDARKAGLPRIDRIVLYIDDLDRCEEEQVVKVLQAVHLLLAFRLFVVVVAVDSRWLLHSLQQHSKAFRINVDGDQGISDGERLHWESTPLNYLEKIFQIPFTLKPVGDTGFQSMIDHLTAARQDHDALGAGSRAQGAAAITASSQRPAGATPATGRNTELTATTLPGATPGPGAAAASAAITGATAAGASTATTEPAPSGATPSGAGASSPSPAASASASGSSSSSPDTPINVLPPHLVIEDWERSYLKLFHELIPTPRAIKRFVNVYRLLKARIPPEDARAFRGDVAGGEHRAAVFLLAVLIGYPSEATDMMRDLIERPAAGDWWPWLVRFFDEKKTEVQPGSTQQERLLDLETKLAKLGQCFAKEHVRLPDLDVFRRWAPYVARFSFQAGRLSGRARRSGIASTTRAGEAGAEAMARRARPPGTDGDGAAQGDALHVVSPGAAESAPHGEPIAHGAEAAG